MSNDFPFNHFINFNNNPSKSKDIPSEKVRDWITPNLDKSTKTEEIQALTCSNFGPEEIQSICEEILIGLKQSISPQKYTAFFENSFSVSTITESEINIIVTTSFIKNMIKSYYLQTLEQIVLTILGTQLTIKLAVLNSGEQLLEKLTTQKGDTPSKNSALSNNSAKDEVFFKLQSDLSTSTDIKAQVDSAEIKHNSSYQIKNRFDSSKTFENFIIGPSNMMANAFCIAIAKDPGNIYPQLYIHGNSGLGKTHLLHALCNYISSNAPFLRICFTNANSFMSEMVMAIQDNNIARFRRKYTELVDILIIDDIHELKNKVRTQSEFFFIFNELQNKGKQLVFTSDKSPKEIVGIEDRIRTRLSSALLIDIQQPDLETRIAILKEKANEKDIYLDDDVINLIASCVKTNVRELEGKLVKLGAYSDLMNVDIDLEIAKEQLNLSEGVDDKILTVESITKVVSGYYKITLGDVKGKSRKKEVAMARHVAMYMNHKILKKTLEEIGEFFDKRDHSTVIHGIKKVQNLIKNDSKMAHQVFEIESKL